MSLSETDKNQGTFWFRQKWPINRKIAAADTCTLFFPAMFHVLLFPLLFPCPAFSHSPSPYYGGACWFHILPTPLCYFCTEIRRRLPFRSQSHISVEFFWHRKHKRALQNNFNFHPILFGKLAIKRIGSGQDTKCNSLRLDQSKPSNELHLLNFNNF